MTVRIKWLPLVLAAALQPAMAGRTEDALLASLRQAHPATRFDRVAPTPVPGLYEVWMGENVAYVRRGHVRYLVFGHLFDTRRMQDVTASRKAGGIARQTPLVVDGSASDGAVDLPTIPVEDAIALVRGTGARRLLVFTDPACAYCRQLDAALRRLRDVTVLHYLLPYQGRQLPEAIWCAQDRDAAYARAMADGAMPAGPAQPCASPLERNLALAARLGVQATPTLVFADGRRIAGALGSDDIEAGLARAAGGIDQADSLARSGHGTHRQ
ncbi:DsbC family protein [Pseudoduganella sp. UC29_71]|uniref:DsbC family protein n=1 Tax=Pseudoduganella sp. UC29_71 TaxID=3350174 RepID=UPI0036724AB2